ncbi:MAG: rod shape-determining protein MreD [Gammaproteobacteria bacterium]|nr:rod shape-determining protein MreD [Gammaproteobacteria bacterium]
MTRRRTFGAIAASFFLAYAFTIVPLPELLQPYRPDLVALTVFFWLVSVPNWIGVGIAFFCGLLLDSLHGSLLGQHALALTVFAYITLKFHLRIRVFTVWQELVALFLLLFIYHFLLFWSDGLSQQIKNPGWSHLAQLFASVAIWPAWVVLLNSFARRSA